MNTAQPTLSERIEIIESAYEFMLAYAAQGRDTDEGLTSGLAIRDVLSNLSNHYRHLLDCFQLSL